MYYFHTFLILLYSLHPCVMTLQSESPVENQTTSTHGEEKEKVYLNNGTLEDNLAKICSMLELNAERCTCDVLYKEFDIDYCHVHSAQVQVQHHETVCQKSNIRMIETITIAVISFFGIIGNVLVLVVRVRNWKLSLHYQLISGLAMADLSFSCLVSFFEFDQQRASRKKKSIKQHEVINCLLD